MIESDERVGERGTKSDEGCACQNTQADETVNPSVVPVGDQCRTVQALTRA